MRLIDIIELEEAKKVLPTVLEFFKANHKKLQREWEKLFTHYAREAAESYGYDEAPDVDVDSEEFKEWEDEFGGAETADDWYDTYSHTTGYVAEYATAEDIIKKYKRKFQYERGMESNQDIQYKVADIFGYTPGF